MRSCAALREVPIIGVSLNNPTANRNVALAAGCNAHLEDPIEFDELDQLLDRLLPGERLPLASILIQ
jgi:CheY-like chemotaxis protein